MRVLYLTYNPNLGSTTRVLQDWLLLQHKSGDEPCVVVRENGPFAAWLKNSGIEYLIDPMPWPSKWWPLPAVVHARKIAAWARNRGVEIIHCNEHDVYPFGVMLKWLMSRPIACSVQFSVTRTLTEWMFAPRIPLVCHVRFSVTHDFISWIFNPRFSRSPQHVIWTSRAQREDNARAVAGLVADERQSVIPLGIAAARFAPDD